MKMFMMLLVAALIVACSNTEDRIAAEKDWPWPDSLDAVAAAPDNHKVVYEDSTVRILQVISPPGNEEPIHTHKFKSTAWFTQSAPLMYYTYVAGANNQLVKKDSFEVKAFPTEALNKG